ncbi:uncharacterized protein LOC6726612 [Drosophila simulans]|uniref:uncharacterized protein LOC6726612 n=1 Tax=Drosophila simulans TaxID=7240 RepID=UPI00078AEB10|nr:uncharacterized protein LOC6726612 [Drosophila simulans]KMZ10952.1 uncharacterized protein Dsimw501_GD15493 [Drosophila simulans]
MLASLNRITGLPAELLDLYGLVVHFLLRGETTLVYYNPAGLDCSWGVLWQRNLTVHPQIVWQRNYSYPDLYDQFNAELFVLACLPMDSTAAIQLETLANSLSHLRTVVRLLIEVAGPDQESLARQYLSFCLRRSMLHVELYFRDYHHSLILYSFQVFPSFELVMRRISGGQGVKLFLHKLDDLRGHRLRVIPDLSPPNTFFYRDARGDNQVTGYLWDFVATFAGRVNAGLEVVRPSWRAGSASDSSYMLEYSAKGLIDVGLTTTLITKRNHWAIHQYTYPLLVSSWCTMLPVEKPLATPDLFGRIVCPALAMTLLLIILVTWLVFRHLRCLARWKNSRPARIVPHLLALLLLTTCSAQLLSLLIFPPYHVRIASFEDLLRGDQKILGMRNEFYDLDGAFRARYAGVFHLIDDPNELYDLRNHFNTTWAYTMAYIKWLVIKTQQRHFSKPVFRWSKDLCFFDFMPTSVIVAPDSIYWESLKDFTFRIHQAGLMKHWVRKSFYDMVKSGKMSIKDYSDLETIKPLNIRDLDIVWRVCGAAIAVASAIFLMELLYFYINVFLNSL